MRKIKSHKDYTGRKFYRYTVLKRDLDKGRQYWICKCICGIKKSVKIYYLLRGTTRSCGCYNRELINKKLHKHGFRYHPIYDRWLGMKQRCYDKKTKKYKWYGGRGIKVCKRWHKFKNFYNDNVQLFKPELELDRYPNPDGDYKPSNIRWATRIQNMRNLSNSNIITYYGITLHVNDWAQLIGVKPSLISSRLSRGWDIENTLTIPVFATKGK